MTPIRLCLLAALVLVLPTAAFAAEPVSSYSSRIKPFFSRYCLECHNREEPKGGLNLETYKSLLDGGDNGAMLTPGKADASRIVRLVEHKDKPFMPPKKAKQPRPEEVALLRGWIDAGAKEDGAVRITVPDIRSKVPVAPPVAALAYHSSGQILAAGGRGTVYFFDAGTGDLLGKLEGLHPRVTALAFSPDGKWLAVASSAMGEAHEVRQYEVECDAERRSLAFPRGAWERGNTHTDVIHDLAFSPDGKILASCGYDRLIKFWDVAAKKELRVLKDHSDSVYGIAFSPDGKLLASAAADRAVKVWDVATGRRLYTLPESTDWVYAVAWSPDGRHLAAAGVDKSIRVWQVSVEGGRIVHSVFAHEAPVLRLAYTHDGATLYSLSEDRTVKAWDAQRMVERKVYDRQPETILSLAVRPDGKQLALGRYDGVLVLLDAATGKPQTELLPIKPKPPVAEKEPNDSPRTGQNVKLPAMIHGGIGRAGDVDFYRFEAKEGQEIGVQVEPMTGARLDVVLQLIDADGRILTESVKGLLGYICPKCGVYALGIRDRDYRGDPGMKYQLTIGDIPIVTSVFPLGLQRGTETEVRLEGVNLGRTRLVRLKVPADAAPGSRMPVPVSKGVLGNPSVRIDEYPQVASQSADAHPLAPIPIPGTANGIIDRPGATQTWQFRAQKGQRLLLEVHANRIGSPLDSVLEILDAKGRPLPWATLRSQAKTYATFRDHDSAATGIRIESWSELAMDDYMLLGNELIRIWELPKNPDDDCQFWRLGGQRRGYLGTTPTFHPMGQPMYKVSIHPPGTTFPPNGLPIITLYYRNDDGGDAFGKDSRLVFDPPADGEYQVRIGAARGQGSSRHAYQLTLRPPRPDFSVGFSPTALTVSKGGAVSINVRADRRDEFDGPIEVRLENLPPGFSAPATTIPAHEISTNLALYAESSASSPAAGAPGLSKAPLKLIAHAVVDGKQVVHEAMGGLPKLIEPGDIVTTTEQSEITLKPGSEVRLTVKIERRNGFKGRIPLEVKGLPHGVRVLDIGLNGILITPEATTRTIAIYAEPWVQPMTHPFVVSARREGKNAEHAAKSVLLRVAK
ncbi:MAG TPA: c-type cytochrome domain-containing protein [Gemmataceae bacterium]|nr:c-type cytochrome domain-containing protein [Gemmataceae bacterium]